MSIVAIVGRPNVGKSTLFNRLIGERRAIVDAVSGVTRDRHYGTTDWNGREFTVVDTGGYVHGSEDVFEDQIRRQVKVAIQEANVLLFMVDVTSGITGMDDEVVKLLRLSKKPVILVANKVDHALRIGEASEFYKFGLGEVFCISSISGSGTGDLLDAVVKALPQKTEHKEDRLELPRFSVVGRPNTGKSSLINALTGQERNIVTPIAGTTRDATDTHYKSYGMEFILVDTAGLRRKSKVEEDIEFYSVMRTINAIESCDVCLLMIDATENEMSAQDINIFSLAEKNHKGIVILVNKWDLVQKLTNSVKVFETKIRERIAPFSDVPIVFTSVHEKQRIFKALEKAIMVYHNRTKEVSTSRLNEIMQPIIEQYPPPATKGKYVKIKFMTQLPTHAPAFAFFCNLPQYVPESYRRFLENKLREHFDFTGVPVRIFFRKK